MPLLGSAEGNLLKRQDRRRTGILPRGGGEGVAHSNFKVPFFEEKNSTDTSRIVPSGPRKHAQHRERRRRRQSDRLASHPQHGDLIL